MRLSLTCCMEESRKAERGAGKEVLDVAAQWRSLSARKNQGDIENCQAHKEHCRQQRCLGKEFGNYKADAKEHR